MRAARAYIIAKGSGLAAEWTKTLLLSRRGMADYSGAAT
jgi:hypothetical protein